MELRAAQGRLQGHRRHRPRPASAGRPAPGAPHVNFAIRPAGRGAPKIDPKPILDGWKLLETTAIYRAAGKDPFGGSDATIGQVLLMSKEALAQRVLADPRIQIYSCGRTDIESGQIDRRILAVARVPGRARLPPHDHLAQVRPQLLHHLGQRLRPLLRATRSTSPQVNGIPILGNQGPGLDHRGRDPRPAEAPGHDAAGADHLADGVRAARPSRWATTTTTSTSATRRSYGAGKPFDQLARVLKPEQWERLIDRLGEIENPEVRAKPSDASLPASPTTAASGQRRPPRRVTLLVAPVHPARVRRPDRPPRRPLPGARGRAPSGC